MDHRILAGVLAGLLLAGGGVAGGRAQTPEAAGTPAATPVASPAASPVGSPGTSPVAAFTTITDVGLAQPESVFFDAVEDAYLISNLNGDPFAADDNGFITKVRPTGEVLAERWIDGAADDVTLNAPKGLAVFDDTLYVADIDVIRLFDRQTGAPSGEIAVPEATFLNDVAAGPDGTIYVSDTGYTVNDNGEMGMAGPGAVYKIVDGTATLLAEGGNIVNPNGLAVAENSDVYVVTLADPGVVLAIQPDGTQRPVVEIPGGMLDGVVILADNSLAISSWGQQAIVQVHPTGEIATLAGGIQSPADIGFDVNRRLILVPDMLANQIILVPSP